MGRLEKFRQGLRERGYTEGKDILIEERYAEGKIDRLPALVAELVRLKVDLIVTGISAGTRIATEATATIPIVMAQGSYPGNFLGLLRLSWQAKGEESRQKQHRKFFYSSFRLTVGII